MPLFLRGHSSFRILQRKRIGYTYEHILEYILLQYILYMYMID